MSGVLNTFRRFAMPAAAPILLNIVLVSALGLIWIMGWKGDLEIGKTPVVAPPAVKPPEPPESTPELDPMWDKDQARLILRKGLTVPKIKALLATDWKDINQLICIKNFSNIINDFINIS